jgi:hypothetical protein
VEHFRLFFRIKEVLGLRPVSKPIQLLVLTLGLRLLVLLQLLLSLLVVVGEVNAAMVAELVGVAVVVG